MQNFVKNVSAASHVMRLAVALLFLVYPINIAPSRLASSMAILAMICLIFRLSCFLRKIYHSIHTFQTRGYLCPT